MIAAKLTRVPNRIYLVTGLRFQGERGAQRWLLKTMERVTCSCATRVIPEGQGVKKTLIEERITMKPLEVVHNGNINGIDTAYYSPESCPKSRDEMRCELRLEENDFAFVFIGRIVGDKGMNELAEAFGKISCNRRCKLLLIGPFEPNLDPLKPDNEQFFRTSESVRYLGYQNDVRPYLLAADALVFPSYREGFPNVVLQAGSMGLPSIVTDINGCNEIILEGENGRIVPARDEKALEEMMDWFLTNPDKVAIMASKSRDLICSRYEQVDVWNALLEMYRLLD